VEELVEGEDEGCGEVRDAELLELELFGDARPIIVTVAEGQIRLGGL
jgi:hypothetical protein